MYFDKGKEKKGERKDKTDGRPFLFSQLNRGKARQGKVSATTLGYHTLILFALQSFAQSGFALMSTQAHVATHCIGGRTTRRISTPTTPNIGVHIPHFFAFNSFFLSLCSCRPVRSCRQVKCSGRCVMNEIKGV